MNRNRQSKLNNKKRKQNEAVKQKARELHEQRFRAEAERRYQADIRAANFRANAIAPRNREGRRVVGGNFLMQAMSAERMMADFAILAAMEATRVPMLDRISHFPDVIEHNPEKSDD